MSCNSDSAGGSSIAYNKSNSKQKEDSKTTEDSMNAGGSVSLGIGYFNASVSAFYSKSNIDNSGTTTTRSNDLSLTFQSGTVTDDAYEYTITPVVYNQPNNLLMLTYDIGLVGKGWKHLYRIPDVILFRVYPISKDPKLSKFTRSIRFYDNKDKTVDIEVRFFCNSYNDAEKIECKVYEGMAIYAEDKKPDLSNCKLIGTLTKPKIDALAREAFRLKNISLSPKSVITVVLSHDGQPDDFSKYYWGVYPYDYFQKLNEVQLLLKSKKI